MTRRLDLSAFRNVEAAPPTPPPAGEGSDDGGDLAAAAVVPMAPTDPPPPRARVRTKTARAVAPAAPVLPEVPAATGRAGKVGPLLPPELAKELRSLGAEGYVISSILTHGLAEFGEEWLADRRQQIGPRRRRDVGRVQVTLYLQGAARSRLRSLAEAAGTSQSEVATGVLRLALAALDRGED